MSRRVSQAAGDLACWPDGINRVHLEELVRPKSPDNPQTLTDHELCQVALNQSYQKDKGAFLDRMKQIRQRIDRAKTAGGILSYEHVSYDESPVWHNQETRAKVYERLGRRRGFSERKLIHKVEDRMKPLIFEERACADARVRSYTQLVAVSMLLRVFGEEKLKVETVSRDQIQTVCKAVTDYLNAHRPYLPESTTTFRLSRGLGFQEACESACAPDERGDYTCKVSESGQRGFCLSPANLNRLVGHNLSKMIVPVDKKGRVCLVTNPEDPDHPEFDIKRRSDLKPATDVFESPYDDDSVAGLAVETATALATQYIMYSWFLPSLTPSLSDDALVNMIGVKWMFGAIGRFTSYFSDMVDRGLQTALIMGKETLTSNASTIDVPVCLVEDAGGRRTYAPVLGADHFVQMLLRYQTSSKIRFRSVSQIADAIPNLGAVDDIASKIASVVVLVERTMQTALSHKVPMTDKLFEDIVPVVLQLMLVIDEVENAMSLTSIDAPTIRRLTTKLDAQHRTTMEILSNIGKNKYDATGSAWTDFDLALFWRRVALVYSVTRVTKNNWVMGLTFMWGAIALSENLWSLFTSSSFYTALGVSQTAAERFGASQSSGISMDRVWIMLNAPWKWIRTMTLQDDKNVLRFATGLLMILQQAINQPNVMASIPSIVTPHSLVNAVGGATAAVVSASYVSGTFAGPLGVAAAAVVAGVAGWFATDFVQTALNDLFKLWDELVESLLQELPTTGNAAVDSAMSSVVRAIVVDGPRAVAMHTVQLSVTWFAQEAESLSIRTQYPEMRLSRKFEYVQGKIIVKNAPDADVSKITEAEFADWVSSHVQTEIMSNPKLRPLMQNTIVSPQGDPRTFEEILNDSVGKDLRQNIIDAIQRQTVTLDELMSNDAETLKSITSKAIDSWYRKTTQSVLNYELGSHELRQQDPVYEAWVSQYGKSGESTESARGRIDAIKDQIGSITQTLAPSYETESGVLSGRQAQSQARNWPTNATKKEMETATQQLQTKHINLFAANADDTTDLLFEFDRAAGTFKLVSGVLYRGQSLDRFDKTFVDTVANDIVNKLRAATPSLADAPVRVTHSFESRSLKFESLPTEGPAPPIPSPSTSPAPQTELQTEYLQMQLAANVIKLATNDTVIDRMLADFTKDAKDVLQVVKTRYGVSPNDSVVPSINPITFSDLQSYTVMLRASPLFAETPQPYAAADVKTVLQSLVDKLQRTLMLPPEDALLAFNPKLYDSINATTSSAVGRVLVAKRIEARRALVAFARTQRDRLIATYTSLESQLNETTKAASTSSDADTQDILELGDQLRTLRGRIAEYTLILETNAESVSASTPVSLPVTINASDPLPTGVTSMITDTLKSSQTMFESLKQLPKVSSDVLEFIKSSATMAISFVSGSIWGKETAAVNVSEFVPLSEAEAAAAVNVTEPSEAEAAAVVNVTEPLVSEFVPLSEAVNVTEPSEAEAAAVVNVTEPLVSEFVPLSEAEAAAAVNVTEPSEAEAAAVVNVTEPLVSEFVPLSEAVNVTEPSVPEFVPPLEAVPNVTSTTPSAISPLWVRHWLTDFLEATEPPQATVLRKVSNIVHSTPLGNFETPLTEVSALETIASVHQNLSNIRQSLFGYSQGLAAELSSNVTYMIKYGLRDMTNAVQSRNSFANMQAWSNRSTLVTHNIVNSVLGAASSVQVVSLDKVHERFTRLYSSEYQSALSNTVAIKDYLSSKTYVCTRDPSASESSFQCVFAIATEIHPYTQRFLVDCFDATGIDRIDETHATFCRAILNSSVVVGKNQSLKDTVNGFHNITATAAALDLFRTPANWTRLEDLARNRTESRQVLALEQANHTLRVASAVGMSLLQGNETLDALIPFVFSKTVTVLPGLLSAFPARPQIAEFNRTLETIRTDVIPVVSEDSFMRGWDPVFHSDDLRLADFVSLRRPPHWLDEDMFMCTKVAPLPSSDVLAQESLVSNRSAQCIVQRVAESELRHLSRPLLQGFSNLSTSVPTASSVDVLSNIAIGAVLQYCEVDNTTAPLFDEFGLEFSTIAIVSAVNQADTERSLVHPLVSIDVSAIASVVSQGISDAFKAATDAFDKSVDFASSTIHGGAALLDKIASNLSKMHEEEAAEASQRRIVMQHDVIEFVKSVETVIDESARLTESLVGKVSQAAREISARMDALESRLHEATVRHQYDIMEDAYKSLAQFRADSEEFVNGTSRALDLQPSLTTAVHRIGDGVMQIARHFSGEQYNILRTGLGWGRVFGTVAAHSTQAHALWSLRSGTWGLDRLNLIASTFASESVFGRETDNVRIVSAVGNAIAQNVTSNDQMTSATIENIALVCRVVRDADVSHQSMDPLSNMLGLDETHNIAADLASIAVRHSVLSDAPHAVTVSPEGVYQGPVTLESITIRQRSVWEIWGNMMLASLFVKTVVDRQTLLNSYVDSLVSRNMFPSSFELLNMRVVPHTIDVDTLDSVLLNLAKRSLVTFSAKLVDSLSKLPDWKRSQTHIGPVVADLIADAFPRSMVIETTDLDGNARFGMSAEMVSMVEAVLVVVNKITQLDDPFDHAAVPELIHLIATKIRTTTGAELPDVVTAVADAMPTESAIRLQATVTDLFINAYTDFYERVESEAESASHTWLAISQPPWIRPFATANSSVSFVNWRQAVSDASTGDLAAIDPNVALRCLFEDNSVMVVRGDRPAVTRNKVMEFSGKMSEMLGGQLRPVESVIGEQTMYADAAATVQTGAMQGLVGSALISGIYYTSFNAYGISLVASVIPSTWFGLVALPSAIAGGGTFLLASSAFSFVKSALQWSGVIGTSKQMLIKFDPSWEHMQVSSVSVTDAQSGIPIVYQFTDDTLNPRFAFRNGIRFLSHVWNIPLSARTMTQPELFDDFINSASVSAMQLRLSNGLGNEEGGAMLGLFTLLTAGVGACSVLPEVRLGQPNSLIAVEQNPSNFDRIVNSPVGKIVVDVFGASVSANTVISVLGVMAFPHKNKAERVKLIEAALVSGVSNMYNAIGDGSGRISPADITTFGKNGAANLLNHKFSDAEDAIAQNALEFYLSTGGTHVSTSVGSHPLGPFFRLLTHMVMAARHQVRKRRSLVSSILGDDISATDLVEELTAGAVDKDMVVAIGNQGAKPALLLIDYINSLSKPVVAVSESTSDTPIIGDVQISSPDPEAAAAAAPPVDEPTAQFVYSEPPSHKSVDELLSVLRSDWSYATFALQSWDTDSVVELVSRDDIMNMVQRSLAMTTARRWLATPVAIGSIMLKAATLGYLSLDDPLKKIVILDSDKDVLSMTRFGVMIHDIVRGRSDVFGPTKFIPVVASGLSRVMATASGYYGVNDLAKSIQNVGGADKMLQYGFGVLQSLVPIAHIGEISDDFFRQPAVRQALLPNILNPSVTAAKYAFSLHVLAEFEHPSEKEKFADIVRKFRNRDPIELVETDFAGMTQDVKAVHWSLGQILKSKDAALSERSTAPPLTLHDYLLASALNELGGIPKLADTDVVDGAELKRKTAEAAISGTLNLPQALQLVTDVDKPVNLRPERLSDLLYDSMYVGSKEHYRIPDYERTIDQTFTLLNEEFIVQSRFFQYAPSDVVPLETVVLHQFMSTLKVANGLKLVAKSTPDRVQLLLDFGLGELVDASRDILDWVDSLNLHFDMHASYVVRDSVTVKVHDPPRRTPRRNPDGLLSELSKHLASPAISPTSYLASPTSARDREPVTVRKSMVTEAMASYAVLLHPDKFGSISEAPLTVDPALRLRDPKLVILLTMIFNKLDKMRRSDMIRFVQTDKKIDDILNKVFVYNGTPMDERAIEDREVFKTKYFANYMKASASDWLSPSPPMMSKADFDSPPDDVDKLWFDKLADTMFSYVIETYLYSIPQESIPVVFKRLEPGVDKALVTEVAKQFVMRQQIGNIVFS